MRTIFLPEMNQAGTANGEIQAVAAWRITQVGEVLEWPDRIAESPVDWLAKEAGNPASALWAPSARWAAYRRRRVTAVHYTEQSCPIQSWSRLRAAT
jgi:hypothetical protein